MLNAVWWIDAFTETRFGGNPCAVVFDADAIPVEERIAFTRETGLVECAFVVASSKADFGARYYMPTGEIPLAGHPTVATVTALIAAGRVGAPASFTLEVGAGVMPIAVTARDGRPPLVTMTQPAPVFGRRYEPNEVAALFGLRGIDIVGTPQTVSTGTPFLITRLGSVAALRGARLDAEALAAFKAAHDADFMEPFLCVTRGATGAGDTFARLPLPPPFPPEDPFTGSATGCMAAWLYSQGWITRRFIAEQGHDLGRPGSAEVELIGTSAAIEGVKVGGSGVVVIRGEIEF
ncbi:PhzF family phenazine biosynthesis protein [Pikeienuella piscinae]|uniref:PhzF family phenazine biosynthesis protein n=1 Tax=Pikeienuella piscinae TaxID=2748098 RepID=A0A7M3T6X9_9RHOB|nr:PhzF family phenazine biosynthesis protein [Pikeienuella piscinae]